MAQKSQEANTPSHHFSEEHESPEAIKQAHEELQRTIQKLRADELAYLKFLYKEERPRLRQRAYSETDPAARQKAYDELQKVQSRLGSPGYKLAEPDWDEWEQRASNTTAERLLHLLDEWLVDESGYDEATWPKLKAALEQDRTSSRSLFDE